MAIPSEKFNSDLFRNVLKIYNSTFGGNKYLTRLLENYSELSELANSFKFIDKPFRDSNHHQIYIGSRYNLTDSRLIVHLPNSAEIEIRADPNLDESNCVNLQDIEEADQRAILFSQRISDLERELNL